MCYTSPAIKSERECHRVKLSDKLDALQEMARAHVGEAHKLYVIELLAEHAEEAEMTAEFLDWFRLVLM